jgi:hypothetical protein
MRERVAWLVALVAVAIVLYIVLPLWALISAIAVVGGVLIRIRRYRRERADR